MLLACLNTCLTSLLSNMISSTLAVNTLIAECKGSYEEHAYNTIVREFKPSYTNTVPGFNNEQLFNKVLSAYVPHEWINK